MGDSLREGELEPNVSRSVASDDDGPPRSTNQTCDCHYHQTAPRDRHAPPQVGPSQSRRDDTPKQAQQTGQLTSRSCELPRSRPSSFTDPALWACIQLWSWWSYAFAAETFAACAMVRWGAGLDRSDPTTRSSRALLFLCAMRPLSLDADGLHPHRTRADLALLGPPRTGADAAVPALCRGRARGRGQMQGPHRRTVDRYRQFLALHLLNIGRPAGSAGDLDRIDGRQAATSQGESHLSSHPLLSVSKRSCVTHLCLHIIARCKTQCD